MANQVYFPQYKQIFEADANSYILISHPTTGRAYKIKISDFQDAITTIYTANGVIAGDRVIDANGNILTINDLANFIINASSAITETAVSGDDSAVLDLSPLTFEIRAENAVINNNSKIYGESDNIEISTNPGGVTDNYIRLTATDLEMGSASHNFELNVDASGKHLDLNIAAGSDFRLNTDVGTNTYLFRSNGSGNPPTWQKPYHSKNFIVADWGAGTTLSITAAIHGLGIKFHHVTVFDSLGDIVPIGATLTGINVSPATGNVTLTIVNNAAAFAGTVFIS